MKDTEITSDNFRDLNHIIKAMMSCCENKFPKYFSPKHKSNLIYQPQLKTAEITSVTQMQIYDYILL